MGKIFAAAAFVLGFVIGSANAGDLDLGSLHINWLDGYVATGSDSPIQLVGPDGVHVFITIWSSTPKTRSISPADMQSTFSRIAESRLPELAAAQGNVVLPLRREILRDGSALYSTATQAGSRHKPEFYLQYMLVAPSARAALFTIEGPGDAVLQHPRFLARFSSVTWADAR